MSESGSTGLGADSEIDDPGREPRGLGGPPRNPLGGPDQDSGRGEPDDRPGLSGPSDVPEAPDDDGA
ncbi:MAG TPA: hypothetical protein VNC79_07315 [Mycobacteriales bacterium]|jgi:hypothetical protein|nr:hypothetical protein [Mycobacteriales bacterium]